MPFNSFKEKIDRITNGEVLGSTMSEKEAKAPKAPKPSPEPKKEKPEKKKKEKKVKQKKIPKEKQKNEESEKKVPGLFSRKSQEILESKIEEQEKEEIAKLEEEDIEEVIETPEEVDGYLDVLDILNIKPNQKIDVEMKSSDLDYIEFSQTTPVGFDFDEVTDFIARMKYILNIYENKKKARDKDVVTLASEIKKIENKMMEQNQAKEMSKMMGEMSVEETLTVENYELKTEVNELKAKMTKLGDPNEIKKLRKENELLKQENKMLIISQQSSSTTLPEVNSPRLPTSTKLPEVKSSRLPEVDLNTLPKVAEFSDMELELPSPDVNNSNQELELPSLDINSIGVKNKVYFEDEFSRKQEKDPIEGMMDNLGGE